MSRRDDIVRLAARIGVVLRHVDALGVVHEPSVETLELLLAALGLPDVPDAAEAMLAQESSAAFGLGAVAVVAAEERHPTLRLRLAHAPARVEWRLRLEDGDGMAGVGEVDKHGTFGLPSDLPLGYHWLDLAIGGETGTLRLIIAPPACYLPPGLRPSSRCWGLTTQLYSLRSANDWGMGDFTALAQLCRAAGACGAATVGVNPLHALFAAEPRHVSPYSPSSRARLNYLYIDVTAVPGFGEDEAARRLAPEAAIAAARGALQIDHAAVAALKRPVLEALFHRFRDRNLGPGGSAKTPQGAAFREFQRDGDVAAFARFEALHEHFPHGYGNFSWRHWPAAMRRPELPKVTAFARDHDDRVAFFQFLQWEADRQLGAAVAEGQEAGLSMGLYRDLAVGVDPHGAEAWADQELVAPGASIGAPPDALSRSGQNWGLAPVNPLVLRRRGFEPFVAALRANMRHAGVLRIDHVMSLQRLYWIPAGRAATGGAYLGYPFHDLLRLVALESHRHRCAVVGEDLGTVPEGFRDTMRKAGVLSYRIFGFERRDDGSFIPPNKYPPLAAASAATHDLATLKGFWLGRDIDWRRRLALYPDAAAEATDNHERVRDRRMLLKALAREGLIAAERFSEFLPEDGEPVFTPELSDAIHRFLARSRSRLMLVQLEDVVGEAEQANLPGTTDAHPNWCRRMSSLLEDLAAGPELRRVAALIAQERNHSASHAGDG